MGQGLSLKAVFVGTIGMALACFIASHSFVVLNSTEMGGDWFPFAASISFLLMLFCVNPLLRLVRPSLELNRAELLLVFVMIFIATPMSTAGFAASFVTNLMAPQYFSSPSNQWWTKLGQYMPSYLSLNDANAIIWFWEGMPPGAAIPWAAWLAPTACWAILFAGLYGMGVALVAILRKQWVENERLIFPLMEVPLSLVEGYENGRRIPALFRNTLFWLGFGLTVAVFGTQIANKVNPDFPAIRLMGANVLVVRPFETWSELFLGFFPAFVAFGFLIKRDVLFSIWLFGALGYVERNIMKSIGYSAGTAIRFEDANQVALAWQGTGAFFLYVLVGLYMARRHLRNVASKVLFDSPEIDDSNEIMRYRPAALLLGLSLATMLVFLIKAGMTLWAAAALIAIVIVLHLGLTRFVIEGGLVLAQPPVAGGAIHSGGADGGGRVHQPDALGLHSLLRQCGQTQRKRKAQARGSAARHRIWIALRIAFLPDLLYLAKLPPGSDLFRAIAIARFGQDLLPDGGLCHGKSPWPARKAPSVGRNRHGADGDFDDRAIQSSLVAAASDRTADRTDMDGADGHAFVFRGLAR